ncbi:MAG TPA: ornithine acetyltransferase [Desulfobacteraceae bacterium]|nr:ornithine acetyltransferase [Desulfobacteraceae bacterium]|tara:strand:+ start:139 stop:1323 length:1185 start_codon:yes stop_codon:yes gene_type:complete
MKGFRFAGIAAGIKKKEGLRDLGLIVADTPCTAAALFTRNNVVAAPVILGKKTVADGRLQAILANAGNANCFTGEKGLEDARATAQKTAAALGISPDLVLVSSTGVIGQPLPMGKFETGIPEVAKALDTGIIEDFADAILTTDTCRKIVRKTGQVNTGSGKKTFHILGVAKGSGMIRPDMATMLAYVLTDVAISSKNLKSALSHANERSFNRITVDGDTSTNDTLACLASGAGQAVIDDEVTLAVFQNALDEACYELARMIVRDGEGATKVAGITVKGAATQEDAFKAAEAIAHSPLVKTAIYGEDPNWGRITAAAGRSGAQVVQDKMDLYFGDVRLVIQGQWQGPEAEGKAAVLMKAEDIDIVLDLNLGHHCDHFLFCDFSENYVRINADYRT